MKLTLLWFYIEVVLSQPLHNVEMMVRLVLGIDQDVIYVDNHKEM